LNAPPLAALTLPAPSVVTLRALAALPFALLTACALPAVMPPSALARAPRTLAKPASLTEGVAAKPNNAHTEKARIAEETGFMVFPFVVKK
jgi:hypothetical protein